MGNHVLNITSLIRSMNVPFYHKTKCVNTFTILKSSQHSLSVIVKKSQARNKNSPLGIVNLSGTFLWAFVVIGRPANSSRQTFINVPICVYVCEYLLQVQFQNPNLSTDLPLFKKSSSLFSIFFFISKQWRLRELRRFVFLCCDCIVDNFCCFDLVNF